MKREDRLRFAVLMSKARVTLPCQSSLSKEEEALRLDVFWKAFEEYRIEEIEKAFEKSLKELKWFPKPSEIIDYILADYRGGYGEIIKQLEWAGPTEEARALAKEMIFQIYQKCDEIDQAAQKERIEKFEASRALLKKQARLIDGKA